MTPDAASDLLAPIALDPASAPEPDPAAEPEGFLVTADDGTRVHLVEWGGPTGGGPGVLLQPGLLATAWTWAPVARRLRQVRRTVVADLRGHGLSDAPLAGYDLSTLSADVIAAGEASGILAADPVVLAGHGLGGMIAAAAAARLGDRCAGLVLVDGGWERTAEVTGLEVDELLRELEEPPEVLRTMDAWLADRRGFDPTTWDDDQERAAREAVVETAAGHVVRAVRPHVVAAMAQTMVESDPAAWIRDVAAPVTVLVSLATGDRDVRLAELRRTAAARADAGHGPLRLAGFAADGHNLMRYRPAEVCTAILEVADPG
jgi:pimeloyl-ACP methyl ester carboxylesterase